MIFDRLNLPAFRANRALIRSLLYAGILLWPISLNAISPIQQDRMYNLFGVTFNTVFLLTAWVQHVLVLNRFLTPRRYLQAVLGSVGAGFFFIGMRYLVEQEFCRIVFHSVNYDTDGLTLRYYIADNQYYALKGVALGTLFKLLEDWFVHQQERRNLVNEKTTAELAFLKSQVNPHFLFNTLNNIYALAYTKSDAAPGAILKLSELMRYMLYDSNGPAGESLRVPLSKEITYLENFVALEKLRVTDAQVEFRIEGNPDLYRIEPLLLVPFVENAFKHGHLTDPANPLVIDLSIRQGKLGFDTINRKANRQKDSVGGVGLQNVRRRLALLYPNRHVLRTTDTDTDYACHLELTL
jgi:two-component system, LytTR family, sensor kinase